MGTFAEPVSNRTRLTRESDGFPTWTPGGALVFLRLDDYLETGPEAGDPRSAVMVPPLTSSPYVMYRPSGDQA